MRSLNHRPSVCAVALLGAALAWTGCASPEERGAPASPAIPYVPPSTPLLDEYKIQVGDVFDVRFYNEPDMNQTLVVRPDGRISLPLAEELLVVGMTPAALDELITNRMSATLRNPDVSIIMKEFAGQKVYVGGEVATPGVFTLRGRTSALQTVFLAGGLLRTADRQSVLVLRNTTSGPTAFQLDLDKQMDVEHQENPFWIEPYDVVFVPETTISKMDDFVDQYIRRLIPISLHAGFTWVDQVGGSGGNSITFVQ